MFVESRSGFVKSYLSNNLYMFITSNTVVCVNLRYIFSRFEETTT